MPYCKGLQATVCTALLIVGVGAAQAELFNRPCGMVYDSVLNTTWQQDANLAATESFGVTGVAWDGGMTWATAQQWIAAMNAANYLGYSDWRLPNVAPVQEEFLYYFSFNGSTDYTYGYNGSSVSSELQYTFFVNLDNQGKFDSSGNRQAPFGLIDDPQNPKDETLFNNIDQYCGSGPCPTFWSSVRYGQNPHYPTNNDAVWVFDMSFGAQSGDYEWKLYRAWAVRDGDVVGAGRHTKCRPKTK